MNVHVQPKQLTVGALIALALQDQGLEWLGTVLSIINLFLGAHVPAL